MIPTRSSLKISSTKCEDCCEEDNKFTGVYLLAICTCHSYSNQRLTCGANEKGIDCSVNDEGYY